jgi:hypothetical protein
MSTEAASLLADFLFGVAIMPGPQASESKEDCKRGGYLKFGPPVGPFKNQGQCVSYVEHHSVSLSQLSKSDIGK